MFAALMLAAALDVDLVSSYVVHGRGDELFATNLTPAGDVDADGVDDLLVFSVTSQGHGVARVISGADGSLVHALDGVGFAALSFQPGPRGAGIGDVDLDGHADFAIGDTSTSRVTLHSGRDASVLDVFRGFDADDEFGASVAGAGDVDGDGTPDLVVGTNTEPGYVRVYSGADGSVLHTFTGDPGDRFGQAVAGAGDVDGDGHDDIAVGAMFDGVTKLNPGFPPFIPPFRTDDDEGSITIFSGADGSLLHRIFGSTPFGGFGFSVCGVGDVDGDGHDDFGAGSLALDEPLVGGEARVFSGRTGRELLTVFDGASGSPRQVRLTGAGDVDGDGTPDLLAGFAPNLSTDPSGLVVSGADGSILFAFTASSSIPVPTGATHAAPVGDVDGDGRDDVAFGAVQAVFGGGFVEVFVTDE